MNTAQRIAKNTIVLLLSDIISKALGFFYTMYTARYLGAEGFGILSFALAFIGIFGVFADLGLSTLTVREVARDKRLASKYLGNIAVMKIILVTATFGLIALTINLLGYPKQTIKVVYLVALSIIFSAFSGMFGSIFQAYEKMEYKSIGQILSSGLLLSGALFAINQGFSVVGFATIYFLASAISLGYSFAICAWKFVLPKIEIDWSFWKITIKEALPFGLTRIFVTIYFWIDSVMLSLMKGNEVVGWYNAAYKLIFLLLAISLILVVSMFPIISRHFISAKNLLRQEYEMAFKYLFVLALFFFIYGLIFADKIILIIYGNGYLPSISALQVLIWVIPTIFLTPLFGIFLASANRQGVVTAVAGANAGLNVLLNVLLIPKFSYIGASIATVLTEGLGWILMFSYISRHFFKIPIVEDIIKPICSSILTAIFLYFLRQQVNWILAAILGVFIYILLMYLFRTISDSDIRLIKQNILGVENDEK
jgi:O-antigen/teichoic acid export membrane protein